MRQYEIEVLLRPAVEFRTATASLLLAAIAFISPRTLLMSSELMAYLFGCLFFASRRVKWRICRFC